MGVQVQKHCKGICSQFFSISLYDDLYVKYDAYMPGPDPIIHETMLDSQHGEIVIKWYYRTVNTGEHNILSNLLFPSIIMICFFVCNNWCILDQVSNIMVKCYDHTIVTDTSIIQQ